MRDILQTQAGYKAKSLGILCGFQDFLTQNPAVFVEIDHIFDFSDTPYGKKKDKQARKAENEVDERNGMKTSKHNTICSF